MSVANKIILSSTLVAILAALAGLLGWKNLRSIKGVYSAKVTEYHEVATAINLTQRSLGQLRSETQSLSLDSTNPQTTERRSALSQDLLVLAQEVAIHTQRHPDWDLKNLQRYFLAYQESATQMLARTDWVVEEGKAWQGHETDLVQALEEVREREYAECQVVGQQVVTQLRELFTWVVVVSLLTFLLAIVFGQLIARGLSAALNALQESARRLQAGDYSSRLDKIGEGELDKLGDTFNQLADDLEKAQIIERQNEELASLNHKLKLKNDSLDSFVYRVSHDLKAPVVNLQSFLKMLRRQLGEELSDRVEKSLFYMDQSADKLQLTIRDLLEVSRIEQSLHAEKQLVALAPMIEDIKEENVRLIEESGAQISTAFGVSEVYFSPPNLKSILVNLIINSVKYRSPDRVPKIQVSTQEHAGETCLTIVDNGLGMDLERYGKKLFGMFNRFHDHVEGSGVGLYIVKKLVEENGARLELDSSLGKGTTFWIYFPQMPTNTPAQKTTAKANS